MGQISEGTIREAYWEFEKYMTAQRWDALGIEGIYADDGMYAIGAFIEFITTGKVMDCDGNELEA